MNIHERKELLQNPELDLAAIRRIFPPQVLEALELQGDRDLMTAISERGAHCVVSDVLYYMEAAVTRSGGHSGMRIKKEVTERRARKEGLIL